MIGKSTYQAAQKVAKTVEQHFADYYAAARERGEQKLAPVPSAQVIETIIDTAFWASLRHEEGQSPKISLVFLPPEMAGLPLLFKQRLPFKPDVLAKLSPGVERPGIHLGVWYEDDELYIWGTTRDIKYFCFVVDVSEPGLLVVKHRRKKGMGKFANVVVLKGDQVKVVDEESASLPDCPEVLTSLLGFSSPSSWTSSVNVLVQLAVSMRAHGHGGSLLVVPADTDEWQESIIQPITYAVQPHFSGLSDLMQQSKEEQQQSLWQRENQRVIDNIAGLTAVDGATVISDKYELLAFGAKIGRRRGHTPVEQIIMTEPVVNEGAVIVHPSQSGGTRHLSAAQFVHDQRNTLALIASQDGRFTIFTWSPCEGMVHAHRIDALLL
ncbi:putative sensor domain DACNV-containing protein [Pontibacter ruber]|uniref:Sensor domain DACNV-containing protein n=1 Tax=Pontibacter ruber TaxID=1343895 RepID=A0ABW5CYC6_9BACT|nr:hypothetical protein [Pontibacter ruber]